MGELKAGVIGKPSALTYEFAEKMLRRYRQDLLRQTAGGREEGEREKELRKVYMVGDNPESDIMGANNYNEHRKFASQPDKKDTETEWISILVKTGVFSPEHVGKGRRYDFDKRPELKPRVVVQDVQEAVEWGLRDAGWSGEGVGVY